MDYKILLNKFLQKRFKKLLAVDIGSTNIIFAVVDGAKRIPVVTALYQEALPSELQGVTFGYNASVLADFINGIVKREKINADAVIFTVGADNSAILTFDMPNMADSELQEAARWELAHELNSEPESFCYATAYLTENNEGQCRIVPLKRLRKLPFSLICRYAAYFYVLPLLNKLLIKAIRILYCLIIPAKTKL